MAKIAYNPSTLKVLYNATTKKVKTQCCEYCASDECSCFSTYGFTPYYYRVVIEGMALHENIDFNGEYLLTKQPNSERFPDLCVWTATVIESSPDYGVSVILGNYDTQGPEIRIGYLNNPSAYTGIASYVTVFNRCHSPYSFGQSRGFRGEISNCQLRGVVFQRLADGLDYPLYPCTFGDESVFYEPYLFLSCTGETSNWSVYEDLYEVNDSVWGGSRCFTCWVEHVPTTDTRPPIGDDWATVWHESGV